MNNWFCGTPAGTFVSMAVDSTGNKYGVADGLIYSFPVSCSGGKWTIVDGLACDDFAKDKMKVTETGTHHSTFFRVFCLFTQVL